MASLAAQPLPSTLSEVFRRHLDLHEEVDSAKQQLRLLKAMVDDSALDYWRELYSPCKLPSSETDTYFCVLHTSPTKVVLGFCLVDWPPLVAMASEIGLRQHVTVGSRDPAIPCSAPTIVKVIQDARREGKKLQWTNGAMVPTCGNLM